MRRVVAIVGLVVVIVLVAIGVHSCQVSQRNSALKDYNSNVYATIQNSNNTGSQFFSALTQPGGARSIYTSVNTAAATADSQLRHARGLSVPDQMKQAQQYLLLTLQMRHDAIADVGQKVEQALGSTARKDAITAIAADMARLYASDVVYKDYMLQLELGALRSAGIAIGGTSGQQVASGQILPSLNWLDPNFVASELHVTYTTSTTTNTKPAPGPHGHHLISVSVGGAALTPGGSSTLTASPPPTFTLTFANTGQSTEHNVVCKVTVAGTPVTGQTIVPQTTPGQQFTCNVPLTTAPPTGTYTVTAGIQRVPGEVNIMRNSQTFQITFK